jgi:hypothetical protein
MWPYAIGAAVMLVIAVLLARRLLRRGASAQPRSETYRHISPSQRGPLSRVLGRHGAHKILLVTFAWDEEASKFAASLQGALSAANWSASRKTVGESAGIRGLHVEVSAGATKQESGSAKALVKWLRSESFSVEGPTTALPSQRDRGAPAIKLTVGTR